MHQGVHPLDKLINDNSLIMLEAMIPFVEYRLKKLLVIYIKYREFTLLMNSLNDPCHIDNCGFNKSASSSDDMMEVILSTLSPDAAVNISNAKKMMSMMKTMENLDINHEPTFTDTENANFNFHITPFSSTVSPEDNTKTSLYDSILNIIEK